MNPNLPEPTTTIVLPDVLLKEIFEHIPTNLALRLILCATKMCAAELKTLNALMADESINSVPSEEHQVTKEHVEPSIVPTEYMSYDRIIEISKQSEELHKPQVDIKFPGLI